MSKPNSEVGISDIVERLKRHENRPICGDKICDEAADEITKLREALRAARKELEAAQATIRRAHDSVRDCEDELNSGRHFRHDRFKLFLGSAAAALAAKEQSP